MEAICQNCGVHSFQHWDCGFMHKCHVCGKIYRTKESAT